MKKIVFILLYVTSYNAFSFSPMWVGVGSTTRNMSTAQSDSNGGTTKFKFNPTLLVGATLPTLFSGYFFSPAIGFGKHSTEDDASRTEILLQYHISQPISSLFVLQYGFSNTITKISGKGGTVSLNNGSSTTSFYTPSASKTSYMASLDLGGEVLFTSTYGAKIQFSLDRFLSSQRRRVSNIITMNYYF